MIDEYLSVDCGEYFNLIKLWQTEQICKQSNRVYNILNRGQKRKVGDATAGLSTSSCS